MKYETIQTDNLSDYSWAIKENGKVQMVGFDKETANRIARALNRDELYTEMVEFVILLDNKDGMRDRIHDYLWNEGIDRLNSILAKIEAAEKGES